MQFDPLVTDRYQSDYKDMEAKTVSSRVTSQWTHKRKLWSILALAFLCGLVVDHMVVTPALFKDPTDAATIAKRNHDDDEETYKDTRTSCLWSPDDQYECLDMLLSRLHWNNQQEASKRIGHRWIFFGDSTMLRLARRTRLGKYLLVDAPSRIEASCQDKYQFRREVAERCRYNEVYDLKYRRNNEWSAPDYISNGEGPTSFGAENPYCTDCSGCQTEFLIPTDKHPKKQCEEQERPLAYGGYFGIEFARDVELQSPEFHTTQENIAAFLSRTYNAPSSVEAWGKPVCVVGVGHHDAAIPNITQALFERNAKWYLGLLEPQCSHVIFLANTSPATEDYPQKFQETKEWNQAVQAILETTPEFRGKSTFVDPFDASAVREHVDNVHMTPDWYDALADFFLALIER